MRQLAALDIMQYCPAQPPSLLSGLSRALPDFSEIRSVPLDGIDSYRKRVNQELSRLMAQSAISHFVSVYLQPPQAPGSLDTADYDSSPVSMDSAVDGSYLGSVARSSDDVVSSAISNHA